MKKIISLLLSLSIIFSIAIPATVAEAQGNVDTLNLAMSAEDYSSAIKITPLQNSPHFESNGGFKAFSSFSDSDQLDVPMIAGLLPTTEDSESYEVEIDHSILPQVTIYAFCYGATGDVTVTLNHANGSKIKQMELINHSVTDKMGVRPKNYMSFSSLSEGVETYTIVVTTNTGNAGFAINIGTKETFVEHFGGNNITTISKYIPTDEQKEVLMRTSCFGTTSLLETGELFHYNADGYTYITATLGSHSALGFRVFDLERDTLIYQTNSEDCGKVYGSIGYVTKGLDLERGKDYVIQFYSTAPISSNVTDYYQIYMGVPYYTSEDANYRSSKSYSISANRETTITIDVSGFPKSAMAEKTILAFNTTSSSKNAYITSCVFTAPNGKKYTSPVYGRYNGKYEFDPVDYFSSSNTPLNGRWTVTIKSIQPLTGVQFKMSGKYMRILGKPGD